MAAPNDYPEAINGEPLDAETWANAIARDLTAAKTSLLSTPLVPGLAFLDEPLTTNTTMQDDDYLFLDLVVPNANFFVRLDVVYDSGVTPGFKSDFTAPAGASCKLVGEGPGGKFTSTTLTAVLTWGGAAVTSRAQLWGLVSTASAVGRLQWRWAQSAASGTTTRRAGSVIEGRRVS